MPLLNTGEWFPILLGNKEGATSLDFIKSIRSTGSADEATQFEISASTSGTLSYTLLEKSPAIAELIPVVSSFGELRDQIAVLSRFIDFELDDNENLYYLRFYLPLRQVADAPTADEKF